MKEIINPKKQHIAILRSFNKETNKTSSYQLYKKIKIPYPDFMRLVLELSEAKFILLEGESVMITALGVAFLSNFRNNEPKDPRASIPKNMLRDHTVSINTFYTPSRSRLDRKIIDN